MDTGGGRGRFPAATPQPRQRSGPGAARTAPRPLAGYWVTHHSQMFHSSPAVRGVGLKFCRRLLTPRMSFWL